MPAGAARAGPSVRERSVLAPLTHGRCTDAVVIGGTAPNRALVYFDREAASLAAAVVTAIADLERSGLACIDVVPDDDLVTIGVLAPRLGVPPRGLGELLRDGPPPVRRCGGELIFRWSDVLAWLDTAPGEAAGPAPGPASGPVASPASEAVLGVLNLALRLRRLVRSDPATAAAVRDLLA
ncbi:hypothetical protein GCM10009557_75840 [Virgisporangium ochraceum]|uniref:DNA-binding protein n=2 Tax=Virgisporangium ochraceum TaxID=65505 RepID=A0A8J4A8H8_9ACTN|nr:hypothetical protein Voc01_102220 [Virgisporangium ochraceum]